MVSGGGGEQQRLTRVRRKANDGFHIVAETHLQHAIGFVQHRALQLTQIEIVTLEMIEDAPRRADHNMRRMPASRAAHSWLAAARRQDLDVAGEARQLTQHVADLIGQFARRAQHQRRV